MIVTSVSVHVAPEHIHKFIQATIENHEHSIQELGNRRFDILQSDDDPARFILYEAWESKEAAKAHKEAEHYRTWRETVANWMAEPREGTAYTAIRPE
ncbi:MAG: antibiotic biosynthesis monooxygenase [Chitinivibrionales bacterium]|nr:antibiotic biosynthesis monooxygenase [Chitinivibrionales bacterium]